MFLLSNLRAAGLKEGTERGQGTWVGAFDGGALVAVACHGWNGVVLLQAPARSAELVGEALRLSGRALKGLIGPLEQVRAVPVEGTPKRPEAELLFTLDTAELSAPPLSGSVRRAEAGDLEQLYDWRYHYVVELLEPVTEATRTVVADGVRHACARGDLFVLELEGRLVATTAFNARLPEIVQIGGVYTPPKLRRRGFARAAVAGSLMLTPVPKAVLFTAENNLAAQRAYRALGFREVGTYGLLLL
jgi:predicted GNAT family acetyltransferase